ncbi:MAG: hypothetical protein ACREOF_09560 [Gemmatimonadales bacterium]
MANVRGDRTLARWHWLRSLGDYRRAHDRHGCAIALHNLGMLSADYARWRRLPIRRCVSRSISYRP